MRSTHMPAAGPTARRFGRRGGLARVRREPPGKRRSTSGGFRPAQPTVVGAPKAEERPADRAEVQKALDSFAAAFGKGDAKAVAPTGPRTVSTSATDGTTFRGAARPSKGLRGVLRQEPRQRAGRSSGYDPVPVPRHRGCRRPLQLRMGKKKELVVTPGAVSSTPGRTGSG